MRSSSGDGQWQRLPDVAVIVFLAGGFHLLEGLFVASFQQGIVGLPSWEATPRLIRDVAILFCCLGILLGGLSALLLRSHSYWVVITPAILVTLARLAHLPRIARTVDFKTLLEALRLGFIFELLYLSITIAVATRITFLKRRRDCSKAQLIAWRATIAGLTLGIGIYIGWVLGGASEAGPVLIAQSRMQLHYLSLLKDQDEERLVRQLEAMLDSNALAMSRWRPWILSSRTRKQIDEVTSRIAVYRQEHPSRMYNEKDAGEYPEAWRNAWRERAQRLEAFYGQAVSRMEPRDPSPSGGEMQETEVSFEQSAGADGADAAEQP